MTRKSADYWAGYHAQAARSAIDAMPNFANLATEVAKQLGRDQARKNRILQRSPYVFAAMDAAELSQASSRELAARELAELGIEVGDCDPVQLLDAHHAGRQWARDNMSTKGGSAARLVGGGGSAQDSSADSFVDRYMKE
jgi:hypothetical protein